MPNRKPSGIDSLAATSLAIRKIERTLNSVGRSAFSDSRVQKSIVAVKGFRQHIRDVVSERMERYLRFYSIPSKRELESLGERVMETNDRLVNIEKMLRDIRPPKSKAEGSTPPRTKTTASRKRSLEAQGKSKSKDKPSPKKKARKGK